MICGMGWRRATMGKIATIGLDIAKSVFQVHGADAAGEVVVRKRKSRARVIPFFAKLPRCLVGLEACSNSPHWARELIALGHDVRLLPEQFAQPFGDRTTVVAGQCGGGRRDHGGCRRSKTKKKKK